MREVQFARKWKPSPWSSWKRMGWVGGSRDHEGRVEGELSESGRYSRPQRWRAGGEAVRGSPSTFCPVPSVFLAPCCWLDSEPFFFMPRPIYCSPEATPASRTVAPALTQTIHSVSKVTTPLLALNPVLWRGLCCQHYAKPWPPSHLFLGLAVVLLPRLAGVQRKALSLQTGPSVESPVCCVSSVSLLGLTQMLLTGKPEWFQTSFPLASVWISLEKIAFRLLLVLSLNR